MSTYQYDLGGHQFGVTTTSADAQLWFDRGLTWCYGYNHGEAVACFEKAIADDPGCAMAHWGRAYAAGPNYNMPWHIQDDATRAGALATARESTEAALALVDNVQPWEAALIGALPARYPQAEVEDVSVMRGWDTDFAGAMRNVFKEQPDSLDVRAVFAEAMMNVTPWKMWDLRSGTPAEGAMTIEAQAVLEEALDGNPAAMRHPGILHLYIHLMEMSPFPERALKAGDALKTLVPDSGHLIHMPTHIDVLCGNYQDVVRWNEAAVEADLKYWREAGPFNIYSGYRLHNYHFVIYGAMFLGQYDPAIRAVQGARDTVPDEMLRVDSPPMADYFESYLSFEPHVLVRFGKWREATELSLPEDPDLFCTLTANVHYARGVAHAALGEIDRAEAEEAAFTAAAARVPETRLLHNNKVVDLLAIGAEMLRGEILYRKGAFDDAFAALRRSVELDDALPYDEPWGWMQPTRHALGALLLEQGKTEAAEAVFREDLGLGGQLSRATVHPDNIWSLKGLHDCLQARGETLEIVQVRQRLDLAQARADGRVAASCFCAQAALRAAE
ncbi:MAG: tetratricopeptide repeat protein [Pseudomonadota bacterium]